MSDKKTDNNNRKTSYRVEGNTIRRLEEMPDYRQIQEERRRKQQEDEKRRRRRAVARNQQKALRMSRSYVIFLTMAVSVFGIFCAAYIKIQSDVTTRMKSIAKLESQLADLKADNDEMYKRINTSIDLDTVKNTALYELGMFYAREDQIVYYTVDKNDYMNQYGEIPEK